MSIYAKPQTGAPSAAIYRTNVRSLLTNITPGLFNAEGVSAQVPFLAGQSVAATLDFPSTAAQESSVLTVSVPGARVKDFVQVSAASVTAKTFFDGYVSAAGVVTVRFNNYSEDSVNPGSVVVNVLLIPSSQA